MSAFVRVQPSSESAQVMERHRRRGSVLATNLRAALDQGLDEIESHLKINYLRGGNPHARRDGQTPLAARSGRLLGATTHKVDGELTGWVGTAGVKYARMLLGAGTTVIKPKNAKHLWIPTRDNQTASGQTRMTPREAMNVMTATGKRALRIFTSKAGNLIAFMPEARRASALDTRQEVAAPTGGRYKRGAQKGKAKGKILFVLKDRVEVEGTDALALSVEAKRTRLGELLQQASMQSLEGGTT